MEPPAFLWAIGVNKSSEVRAVYGDLVRLSREPSASILFRAFDRHMPKTKVELTAEVEKVLDVLRQGILMHGGNVELVDVEPESGRVTVRLQGACVGCAYADMTLTAGIEETLKELVPEVKEVVADVLPIS